MSQPGSWLSRYWDLVSLLLLSAWVMASVKDIHRPFRSSLWFLGPFMGQETLTSIPVELRGSTSVINCEVNSNYCYHCQFQPGFLTERKNLLAQWLPEGVYNARRSSTGCVLCRNTWGVLYSKMLESTLVCYSVYQWLQRTSLLLPMSEGLAWDRGCAESVTGSKGEIKNRWEAVVSPRTGRRLPDKATHWHWLIIYCV